MIIAPTRSFATAAIPCLAWLLVAVFFAAGVVKLVPIEFERAGFAHFGYATWFMYLIGVVEIAGACVLALRTTRQVGALLLAAVMVGAVASHLNAGDGVGMATPAIVLLGLLLVVAARSGAAQGWAPFARVAADRSA